jgi:small GTP-binding protein
MIQKKICLLGAFSVGKTSLIQRFVNSIFDDKYLTTVGVKVDKKNVEVDSNEVMMMIWDLAGEDDYSRLQTTYLRGSAGYVLVVDGTRPNSLDTAFDVHEKAVSTLGDVPFILALNKADLVDQWMLPDERIQQASEQFTVMKTSAKTGENVENLFSSLARQML